MGVRIVAGKKNGSFLHPPQSKEAQILLASQFLRLLLYRNVIHA